MILGLGLGVLRDISDRVFRSTSQVEERLKADCISVVPLVKSAPKPKEEQWPDVVADGPADRRIVVDDQVYYGPWPIRRCRALPSQFAP